MSGYWKWGVVLLLTILFLILGCGATRYNPSATKPDSMVCLKAANQEIQCFNCYYNLDGSETCRPQ